MERTFNRTGFLNWLALLGGGAGVLALSAAAGCRTGEVTTAFFAVGLLVALVSWFQMRLEAREQAERLEMEDLARSRNQAALFDTTAAETFPARRSREQFERWLLPVLTFLKFALEAAAVVWFYQRLRSNELGASPKSLIAVAGFAGTGLVLLLLGLYGAKLARYAQVRLLRPGSSHLVLAALLCFVSAGAEVSDYAGYPLWDGYAAWVLVAILALMALETLFALVFEAFRPRVPGRETRLTYESRLIGLLGQPAGLFGTAAQALDYQFGFKVSDTWFYKFVETALPRLVLFQFALIMVFNCFVVLDPGEEALVERFGGAAGVLEPGLHFKLPWPIDIVHRFNTRAVQSFNIGFTPDPDRERENVMVWTRSHYLSEVNFLVASREQETGAAAGQDQTVPANLLTVSIPVQYVIRDVRAWGYNHTDPGLLLERIANRVVVRYLASVDLEKLMSYGREEAGAALRQRMQEQADAAKLGVQILFVGLQDIHPPQGNKEIQVAASFEQVIGAEQDREARVLEARGYAMETVPAAAAAAAKLTNSAYGTYATKVQDAIGRAAQFTNQLAAYHAAPTVYLRRSYSEAFTRATAGARKLLVLPTNTHDVVILDLTEKLRRDLGDVDMEVVKPKDKDKK